MAEMAILADDFTGALDTCVQFSSRGIRALLFEDNVWQDADLSTLDVLVLNLSIRHVTQQEAYDRVLNVMLELRKCGLKQVYIKTDSGLRGNIGAYLAAAVDGWKTGILFAPAYPDAGRVLREGILYISGVPVSESIFGGDIYNPVLHSKAEDIIHEETDLQVVADYIPKECVISLQNAETNDDLDRIAQMGRMKGYRLFAGCAAFASALSSQLQGTLPSQTCPDLKTPMVVISGSMSPITLRQYALGEKSGFKVYAVENILDDNPDFQDVMNWIQKSSDNGVLIQVPSLSEKKKAIQGVAEIGQRICRNLGILASMIVANGFCGTLMVIGGDTLSSVISELQVVSIRPVFEIETGVVVSEVMLRNHKWLTLITKSGSFGSEKVLPKIRNMLTVTKVAI